MQALRLDTVILHDDTRASDDLSWIALTINLAETSPSSEDLGVTDFNEVDLVLGAECLDELEILCFRAGLDENAEMCLALVKGLGALTEPPGETVVEERVFQDLLREVAHRSASMSRPFRPITYLQGLLNGHLSLGGIRNVNGGGFNGNVISSVRHPTKGQPISNRRLPRIL